MSRKLTLLDWLFLLILAVALIFMFFDNDLLKMLSKIGLAVSLIYLVIRNVIGYWKKFIKK